MSEVITASCSGCSGTGDQSGNPELGACEYCDGEGEIASLHFVPISKREVFDKMVDAGQQPSDGIQKMPMAATDKDAAILELTQAALPFIADYSHWHDRMRDDVKVEGFRHPTFGQVRRMIRAVARALGNEAAIDDLRKPDYPYDSAMRDFRNAILSCYSLADYSAVRKSVEAMGDAP